jgi:hypothetical protein
MSASVKAKLQAIDKVANIDQKIIDFKLVISEVLKAKADDDAKYIIDQLMGENVASALSKQAIAEFAKLLETVPNNNALVMGTYALDQLATKGAAFEAEDAAIRS